MLPARAPDTVACAVDACAPLARKASGRARQGQGRCARARCEAERATRQEDAVEPAPRRGARNRATPWDVPRRAVDAVQREDAPWQRQPDTALSGADRQALLDVGPPRPAWWDAETTTPTERKRLGRLGVRDVMLDRRRAPDQGWLQSNGHTGATPQPWVPRHRTRESERGTVDTRRQRRPGCTATGREAQTMAAGRNEAGDHARHGGPLTRAAVWDLRTRWGIASSRPEPRQGSRLRGPEGSETRAGVADVLGVQRRTGHTWIQDGRMVPSHADHGAPLPMAWRATQRETCRASVPRVRRPRRVHTAACEAPRPPSHARGAPHGPHAHTRRVRPHAGQATTATGSARASGPWVHGP